jgi:hypothetical protein
MLIALYACAGRSLRICWKLYMYIFSALWASTEDLGGTWPNLVLQGQEVKTCWHKQVTCRLTPSPPPLDPAELIPACFTTRNSNYFAPPLLTWPFALLLPLLTLGSTSAHAAQGPTQVQLMLLRPSSTSAQVCSRATYPFGPWTPAPEAFQANIGLCAIVHWCTSTLEN